KNEKIQKRIKIRAGPAQVAKAMGAATKTIPAATAPAFRRIVACIFPPGLHNRHRGTRHLCPRSSPQKAGTFAMPTYGFVIDNRKCIGCHACTVACKSEHQVPLGVDRTWVKYVEKGTFPNNRRLFTVMRCNHCEWAPCVTICPVTALYTRSDGVVDFNSDRCIGCKACLQACPYDALYIDPNTDTAAKCNFCTH